MIKGIFCVLKSFFIWGCFCYLPFGLIIMLKICNQKVFDCALFALAATSMLIALIVIDRQFKKQNK